MAKIEHALVQLGNAVELHKQRQRCWLQLFLRHAHPNREASGTNLLTPRPGSVMNILLHELIYQHSEQNRQSNSKCMLSNPSMIYNPILHTWSEACMELNKVAYRHANRISFGLTT
jgi:hypothetical protein